MKHLERRIRNVQFSKKNTSHHYHYHFPSFLKIGGTKVPPPRLVAAQLGRTAAVEARPFLGLCPRAPAAPATQRALQHLTRATRNGDVWICMVMDMYKSLYINPRDEIANQKNNHRNSALTSPSRAPSCPTC